SGPAVRYLVSESDPLGQLIDLRSRGGTLRASLQPVVEKGAARVDGDALAVELELRPVRQIVYVNFLPSYLDSLRKFGLRAAAPLIRTRVREAAARDCAGLNIEFRQQRPDDFALYSEVELGGPDPNGQGLLGYDNTPGKDTDNRRLYDRIGGVNAVTQLDGS